MTQTLEQLDITIKEGWEMIAEYKNNPRVIAEILLVILPAQKKRNEMIHNNQPKE